MKCFLGQERAELFVQKKFDLRFCLLHSAE